MTEPYVVTCYILLLLLLISFQRKKIPEAKTCQHNNVAAKEKEGAQQFVSNFAVEENRFKIVS